MKLSKVLISLIALFFPSVCLAQLCQGVFGEPVVFIDFGSGTNPGLPSSSATYNFDFSDCPTDGSYTIANSVSSCLNGGWHNITADHTSGDTNGYMMLVNGSAQSDDFFVQRINNLCSNTTYEFAAWIMALHTGTDCNKATYPNLSFRIETLSGDVLKKYDTGDLDISNTPEWKQYGSFFTLPSGENSLVLRITNNNLSGGCGNDIALDDITFRACAQNIQTFINDEEISSTEICEGTVKTFKLSVDVSSVYTLPKFVWQRSIDESEWQDIPDSESSQLSVSFNPATAGLHRYRVLVAESENFNSPGCRLASNPITIDVQPYPDAKSSNNGPFCIGGTLELSASGGSQYLWQGPNNFVSTLQNPVISNAASENAGKYTVTVSSSSGCAKISETEVTFNPALIADAGPDRVVCKGTSIILEASGGDFYSWTPSTGLSDPNISNPVAHPDITTTYTVTVSKAGVCSTTDEVTVTIDDTGIADAGRSFKILEGQSVELQGSVTGSNISYFWTPSTYLDDPLKLNPVANPPVDMTYTLNVLSKNGCLSSSDEATIKVYREIVINNTFSPNNDGVNDLWNIYPLDEFNKLELTVYNRFGTLVFKSKGAYKPWNGKFQNEDLPPGTYYYVLDLGQEDIDVLKGWVMIVR